MKARQKEVHATMLATLKRLGCRPEIIYAFEKTGRIVTEETTALLSPEDLAEWQAAIDEFRAAHHFHCRILHGDDYCSCKGAANP